ncbi:AraC-like DNA-binding protein [Streptomyces afghaniensis]|uniref:helix-turn-helix domain-containing protein n=1 Tax=Streptomyces afghaniensis TaxID=66865 RepID=UPI00278A313D|nr:helix-turn-helix domain-containing protein [Streptomyces afghaniensis]MDQ1015173.1 AraC-like DNA-binding protein [Streptomyces afghaniensis]
MIETVFRTHDVPKEDRFDMWQELISRTHAPMSMESSHKADFQASQRVLALGDVTVWPTTFQPVRFVRTQKQVRGSDPETVHVSLPARGTLRGLHCGSEIACGPGTFCVLDSSRPVELTGGDGDLPHTGIGMEVPKALLPPARHKMTALTTCRLSEGEGFGALLGQFLRHVAGDAASYGPSDGPRLAAVAVDLLSAMFAHALDAERSLPPETHRRTLVLRIRAFILQRLHDPLLTPPVIAAAHHISISYLHRLFQEEDDTVAAFVRRQRLARTRRDLSDPAQRTVSVHEIAARWGFTHQAVFSRAFRSAYGVPPRDYRETALAPAAMGAARRRIVNEAWIHGQ